MGAPIRPGFCGKSIAPRVLSDRRVRMDIVSIWAHIVAVRHRLEPRMAASWSHPVVRVLARSWCRLATGSDPQSQDLANLAGGGEEGPMLAA